MGTSVCCHYSQNSLVHFSSRSGSWKVQMDLKLYPQQFSKFTCTKGLFISFLFLFWTALYSHWGLATPPLLDFPSRRQSSLPAPWGSPPSQGSWCFHWDSNLPCCNRLFVNVVAPDFGKAVCFPLRFRCIWRLFLKCRTPCSSVFCSSSNTPGASDTSFSSAQSPSVRCFGLSSDYCVHWCLKTNIFVHFRKVLNDPRTKHMQVCCFFVCISSLWISTSYAFFLSATLHVCIASSVILLLCCIFEVKCSPAHASVSSWCFSSNMTFAETSVSGFSVTKDSCNVF